MRIGMIGCGKLGGTVALAINSKGHEVIGTDINPNVGSMFRDKVLPYEEDGAQELLNHHTVQFVETIDAVIQANPDVVFVAVQTPHEPRFEGVTRLPRERVDFNYDSLVAAAREVAEVAMRQKKKVILAIISTVLPGTVERLVKPVLNDFVELVYGPLFIAMGTTVRDFLYPEFVLLGVDDLHAAQVLEEFYGTITDAPVCSMRVASAELTKVAYNGIISTKITYANMLMEICEKTQADCDEVISALKLATTRIVSTAYMDAGMGDSGNCHPRDGIALSWLARKLNMSFDLFDNLMQCREAQTEWIASLALAEATRLHLPIVIMGQAYKRGTKLVGGSCGTLLLNILKEWTSDVGIYDPHITPDSPPPNRAAVYVMAMEHDEFKTWTAPEGSVVLDPWGITPKGPNVRHIGRKD